MLAIVASATVLAGVWSGVRGVRLILHALRDADHPRASLDLIRGIRGIGTALAAAAVAGGLLSGQTGWLVLGAVFLAEELYETGVVALVLRERRTLEAVSQRPSRRPGDRRRRGWRTRVQTDHSPDARSSV
jgi:hypothetical protein